MVKYIVLVASCLLAFASAQITTPGQCDESVEVVKNFDVPAYAGLWYEAYRYEQFDQLGGDCVTATYTPIEVGVQVFNRMVISGNAFNITGTAIVDPDAAPGEGKLLVTFPSVNLTSQYWVLSTNYDSYALVYVCDNLSNNRKRISSWILSRTQNLRPQDVLVINEAINKVEGLDWGSYRFTNQSETYCAVGN